MSGDDTLTAQRDIDFAVAAVAYVRELLDAETGDHALHYDPDCEECVYLARPVAIRVATDPAPGREALWEKFTAGEKLAYGCGYRDGRGAALGDERGAALGDER